MTRIERPISGYVARDAVANFEVKYGADELALAVSVDDIVQVMHNGYDAQPLMLVANACYSVPIIVSHIKEAIVAAVETGKVPAFTAAHLLIQQTDDGEGAVALELIPPDPNRRVPRHIKAADDRRVKAGKALGSGKATDASSTVVSTKYAGILAESRLAQNGTLASLLETREPVTA